MQKRESWSSSVSALMFSSDVFLDGEERSLVALSCGSCSAPLRQLEDKPSSKAKWEELRPVVNVSPSFAIES